ncbi:MAG: phytoene desaturase [Pseudomonadota bacterium]
MLDITGYRGSTGSRHDGRPHAIVIGSGFGGLASAIRLGARGYRVTVLEKLDAPGGRARVHRQDGFTFDAGPTIVTAPFLFEELWAMCGRKLSDDIDLRPVSPFYRIRFHDGDTFDYSGDPQAMEREVARIAPGDLEGYRSFMAVSEATYRAGFERLGHVPFGSIMDMVRILPDLARLQCFRSVHGEVARHVRSEKLRQVLSFHPLLIGGNPFTATSIYCLIAFLEREYGVHFAMGGTGRLVSGMVRLIEGQGGTVHCNTPVRRIAIDRGAAIGVQLDDGSFLPSDIVISNADSATTYRDLVDARFRKRWTDRKIERARYSMSLFVWYFGTRRQYPDVQHHTIMLGPRYRELLNDIFSRKVLAGDFSLYLHRPTATDPSLAPPGCDAFYVLSPVPHLEAGIDWSTAAEPYRAHIARYLGETLLPNMENEVVTSLLLTPQDFQDDLSSFRGAAFGLEPVLWQSAWFRPHNKSEDIENLFIVGAGTHPGAGLPGVLSSARILDTVVPDAMAFAER